MTDRPIADYALLSDCQSSALVSRDGSVDWCSFARFDAPAMFARILDENAGHFTLRPAGDARVVRRYVNRSLVLETTYEQPEGVVVITDALATGPNPGGHDLGLASTHTLFRVVECRSGRAAIDVELAPRPEYGLVRPIVTPTDGGVVTRGGAEVLRLSSPVALDVHDSTARGRAHVRSGDRLDFALQHGLTFETPGPRGWSHDEIDAALAQTLGSWRAWSEMHQRYEGPWKDLVDLSGRVLQGLTFAPSGAIVAAPTTSLPETVGGARNWDYRFSWIRDAALTLTALWVAACPHEAHSFFDFLARAAATDVARGDPLQIAFGVRGEHDLSERVLPHLAGWRGSRPVRAGNGAWGQRQLDVSGELLAAAERLRDRLGDDAGTAEVLVAATDAAARHWGQPDQGIWEVRSGPQHFLHSKLMCWVALDRAVDLAPLLGAEHRVDDWRRTREEIRAAILEQGWSSRRGAFTQAFGSDVLDASALTLPLFGFLPDDDPRVVATVDAVARELTDDRGFVYRYLDDHDDGVGGAEGTFVICTFWLARCLAQRGDVARARAKVERVVAHANDLGLLAEQIHPATGELLGNFPQAFSHVGLVNASWSVAEAENDQHGS